MANVFATKSGNWSDTTVWNTGALPTTADDVFANNFVVNVDISPTVLTVRNTSGTGITAGGRFELQDGVTLTCTNSSVGLIPSNSSGVVVFSLAAPATATLAATLTPGTYANTRQLVISGTGTLNVIGNMNQTASLASAIAVQMSALATLNYIGNITSGGNGVQADGITLLAGAVGATVNITGDLIPCGANGQNNFCIRSSGACTINVTGNCYWSSGGFPSLTQNSGCFSIPTGSPTITITGNVTGSNISNQTELITVGGALTIIGTITGGTLQVAVSASGTLFVTGPLIASTTGVQPIYARTWRWQSALTPTYYAIRNSASTAYRNLYTSDNPSSGAGQPATINVRSGIIYGPTNEYTGTCAVPAAGSVALGVPVDATTGTAVLTAANVQTALTSQGLTTTRAGYLDNISSAAPSAATIAAAVWASLTSGLSTVGSIGKLLVDNVNATISSAAADSSGVTTLLSRLTSGRAANLDNLDAAVSSRLASSSYQAPLDAAGTRSAVGLSNGNLDTQLSGISSGISGLPSASAIASAVWSAATRTLTTAIDNSSTIAAAVWSYATGRTITGGTVDTLVNSPSVPSAAAIASQVRTELSTELDRLDTNVSSRLPSSSYSAPPTAAQNATAVRSELSTELSRLDASVSSRLAPAGTLARVTLTDTATTLTNAPSVPSPQTVAQAVRTELAPELSHLDADVSSRQATLARLQNVATTQEVGDIVEGALSD